MKRFVLQENLRLFNKRLLEDVSDQERAYLCEQIALVRRELALLNVGSTGAQSYPTEFGTLEWTKASKLQKLVEDSDRPTILIDPRAGFHIVDLNDAYQAVTLSDRSKVAGLGMFEAFPDNPSQQGADGVANLFESIQAAAQYRRPHTMQVQRYDVRDSNGRFVTRYWRCENIPILNEDQQVVYILHRADDITDYLG